MPGLVPGIHVFLFFQIKTWMAGASPAMTNSRYCGRDVQLKNGLFLPGRKNGSGIGRLGTMLSFDTDARDGL